MHVRVSDIHSCQIMEDIENFQECSLDEMLNGFIVHATGQPQESFDNTRRTRLFEECLEIVLPICNGEAQANDINPSTFKEYLVQYSEAHGEHEDKLYPSFVTLANVALQYLQEVKIPDLRPFENDNASIRFHVNGPPTTRKDQLSERKPNVVVISRSDTHGPDTSEQQILCWRDILFTILTKASKKPAEWRNARTFVQFKRLMTKMAVPPDQYTLKEITPPQEADVSIDEAERARCPLPKPGSRKRICEHLSPPELQSKRQKFKHADSHPVIVQAGHCAEDMLAAFAACEHAISLVIIGDVLYVWWYDRQRTIQYSGLNFIEDLPRFLVLLLAMPRFEARHWGLNPHVDPTFGPRPLSQVTIRGDEGKEIQVGLWLSDETRVTNVVLNGRATNIIPVECQDLSGDSDIAAKISRMELAHMGEPETLKRGQENAETDPDVNKHISEMLWFMIFHDTSTANIRERLGLDTEGVRVLRVITFRKLSPITELYGDDFLHAWWATVKCHHALWKHGIYHRDISASTLMYHRDKQNQVVAALDDFDMASIQATAIGTQCTTATVPFMALQLLTTSTFEGDIPHVYEHDAESFICVLVWITLRYANGKLKGDRYRPLDKWWTEDLMECRKEKRKFLTMSETRNRLLRAGTGHEQNWQLAKDCIMALRWRWIEREEARRAQKGESLGTDTVFQWLLELPTSRYLE